MTAEDHEVRAEMLELCRGALRALEPDERPPEGSFYRVSHTNFRRTAELVLGLLGGKP